MILKIDNEFKNLIPPLTQEEHKQLEENILKEGCRDSLIVWNGTIIDGHNRYSICTKHNIQFKIEDKQFDNRQEVIEWIILNQFGRRNLPNYERAKLALRLKPIIEEKAKEQQITHTEQGYQKSDKAIHTTKELAKVAGVSHDTIHKVEKIEEKASPEIKEKLSKQEISINQAYKEIKQEENKQELLQKKEEYTKRVEVATRQGFLVDKTGQTTALKIIEFNSTN